MTVWKKQILETLSESKKENWELKNWELKIGNKMPYVLLF